ncbi:hypothetical protein F2Q68_00002022 [Brassica cretica]|uniref:RNase H type-1 domain-containing protein n=2 Tax=Brassica cretica TaxID=69181 RepID=A0ABQ7BYX8_BRACR|nr:hypothetical protein F2Q68_00002022 [Brassica cretica]KAF3544503.1 hypothetical protein DY000_02002688 [Brassica cretica]
MDYLFWKNNSIVEPELDRDPYIWLIWILPSAPQEHSGEEFQVISLDNIFMVDGSWTSTAQFSGCRWVLKDSFGKIQLRRRETALHLEVEALRWAM